MRSLVDSYSYVSDLQAMNPDIFITDFERTENSDEKSSRKRRADYYKYKKTKDKHLGNLGKTEDTGE